MARDLAELQDELTVRGYTRDFARDLRMLPELTVGDLRIVESVSFDSGTDPGDDATMYLIEARGSKGYLLLSDSFHTDPRKAAFIDAILAKMEPQGRAD